ncbi:MAG: VIT1/CCC1 transporter family protein [Promethearchaeota archaeon]
MEKQIKNKNSANKGKKTKFEITKVADGVSDHAYEDRFHIAGGEVIREIVFGANDGIVSVFALLAGIAGAGQSPQIILLTLLAATIAGALSMGAGEFISAKSERNYFEHEIRQERLEVKLCPEIEREEVRKIYRKKGFRGEVLEMIVSQITSNEDLWVREMVIDELGVANIELEKEFRGVIFIFIAFIGGAMFPTAPYMILPLIPGISDIQIFWSATIITMLGLFLVGAMKKFITGMSWLKSGIEMLLVGTFAFSVSYIIGLFIGVSV